MKLIIRPERVTGKRDPMIYGHFIEHFHRQIYGGIYDPGNPLSDADGLRVDVMDAMRKIRVPVLRWPGGCFVSSHHWKEAVGRERIPSFDKAWRVEDPNTFGTDEFIDFCRKVGCEPYICTNAGTGSVEEMSDWVEYCNLETEGRYARWRIENGHTAPYGDKYWSIGNENYGHWELGAKTAGEWPYLVLEAAKMMHHVDPTAELSAAALTDLSWNVGLLQACGEHLQWLSIHEYWDAIHQTNDYATYEQAMAYTQDIGASVRKVRGLLMSMGLETKIRIAFDEWNLRGWYHPNAHTIQQGRTKADYLYPRDANDDNSKYTMADAVFTACFLNMCNRNCDIVGMANFAPVVNTRGCIFTHPDGIVLRSTYHVFDLFANRLGDVVLDAVPQEAARMTVQNKQGQAVEVDAVDMVATLFSDRPGMAVSAVNKDTRAHTVCVDAPWQRYRLHTVSGDSTEAYNDIGHEGVALTTGEWQDRPANGAICLSPHAAHVIEFL